MNTPSIELAVALTKLRLSMTGAVSVLCEHAHAECEESLDLYRRILDNQASIQGNRPNGSPVTMSDLRLMMTGTLRILLEELEAHS